MSELDNIEPYTFCEACGQKRFDDELYCMNCGTMLLEERYCEAIIPPQMEIGDISKEDWQTLEQRIQEFGINTRLIMPFYPPEGHGTPQKYS